MKRISEYDNITTVAENDVVPIVDVSDTEQASTGSTRKGTIATIADYIKDRAETLTNKILTTARLNTPKINEDVTVTATSTELNTLDGITSSTAELNQLDGVTVGGTASGDIVTIDGTQTLTGKTLTSPKLNKDVALTANSTELNLLDNQTVLRKQSISGYSYGATVAAGETKYIGHGLGTSAYTVGFVFACAGTIRNLYVYSGGSPGVGQTYTCTLMKDNVAQSVTCTIPETGNFASDTTHSFSVSAVQRVSLRFVASAGAASTVVQFAFQFEPS